MIRVRSLWTAASSSLASRRDPSLSPASPSTRSIGSGTANTRRSMTAFTTLPVLASSSLRSSRYRRSGCAPGPYHASATGHAGRHGPAGRRLICARICARDAAGHAETRKTTRDAGDAQRGLKTARVGGSAPFRRDCSQDCSQGAEQHPTHLDNSGIRPTHYEGVPVRLRVQSTRKLCVRRSPHLRAPSGVRLEEILDPRRDIRRVDAEFPGALLAVGLRLPEVAAGGAVKAFKTTPLLSVAEGVEAMRKAQGAGYRRPAG